MCCVQNFDGYSTLLVCPTPHLSIKGVCVYVRVCVCVCVFVRVCVCVCEFVWGRGMEKEFANCFTYSGKYIGLLLQYVGLFWQYIGLFSEYVGHSLQTVLDRFHEGSRAGE